MKKQWMFYIVALIITLSAAVYQRLTGPTHPQRSKIVYFDNNYNFKLPRSSENDADCKILLPKDIPADAMPVLVWRHFPSAEKWEVTALTLNDDGWEAVLPKQPAAGKLEYFIRYNAGDGVAQTPEDTAIVIRFKGPVPKTVLIPHILFMFLAMFFSNLMGLESLFKNKNYLLHAWIGAGLLLVGGFILGPLVQQYAFGDLWTGVPFGWDLTDNKTLIAGLGFALGLWKSHKTGNPKWILMSSIIMLLVYLIPHSVMGSTLDYSTGKVVTG